MATELLDLKPIDHGSSSSPWSYFALAFGFSWFFWGLAFLFSSSNDPVSGGAQDLIEAASPIMLLLMLIGVFGPSFSAFILTFRHHGKNGIAKLWKSGWNVKIGWKWLAVVLFLYPLIKIISLIIAGEGVSFRAFTQPFALIGIGLFIYFLGGPFGEEFGWRGYALPRLLQKYNWVSASIILGLFWVCWHLPLFIIPGSPQAQIPFIPWAVSVTSFAIILTWVYINTGGVVFAAIAMHFSSNWSNSLFLPATEISGWGRADNIGTIIEAVIAIFLIPFLIKTWKKHLNESLITG